MGDEAIVEMLRRRGDDCPKPRLGGVQAADRLRLVRRNWDEADNWLFELQADYSTLTVGSRRLLYAANVALGYLPILS